MIKIIRRILLIIRSERAAKNQRQETIRLEHVKRLEREQAALEMRIPDGYAVCDKWDAVINELCELIETGQIEVDLGRCEYLKDACHVTVGEFKIWKANYGWCDSHPHNCGLNEKILAKPITRVRFHEALESAMGDNYDTMSSMLEKTRMQAWWHNNVVSLPDFRPPARQAPKP